jgi:DNA-binding MarR family transcriptional regulator
MPARWTFLSNHAHVLICLARDGDLRMRDLAAMIGITERAVQMIVADLVEAGYLRVTKDGRRNSYTVVETLNLRHPVEAHRTIRDLLRLAQ